MKKEQEAMLKKKSAASGAATAGVAQEEEVLELSSDGRYAFCLLTVQIFISSIGNYSPI